MCQKRNFGYDDIKLLLADDGCTFGGLPSFDGTGPDGRSFISASAFDGHWPGYVFKQGTCGLGYYNEHWNELEGKACCTHFKGSYFVDFLQHVVVVTLLCLSGVSLCYQTKQGGQTRVTVECLVFDVSPTCRHEGKSLSDIIVAISFS